MKTIEALKTEKKHHLDRLLELGIVMILVDARRMGVDVPEAFRSYPKLPLNISYTYQIPDFLVLEDRVEVTLTFPTGGYFCVFPLDSIYVINSQVANQTVVFPEDVPTDIPPPVEEPKSATEEPAKRPSHLKLVK